MESKKGNATEDEGKGKSDDGGDDDDNVDDGEDTWVNSYSE